MPAQKPTRVREQIVELAKGGHSARVIEAMLAKRGVKAGKSAIAELVREYRKGATPELAAKASPAPAASSAPKAPPRERSGPVADDEPLDAAEVADLDLEQLAALALLFDQKLRGAVAESDVRLASWLLDARMKVSRELAKLRPVALPDPEKDPANIEAKRALRKRLERAIAVGRRSDAGLDQLRAHLRAAEEAAAKRQPEEAPPAAPEPT